MRKKCTQMSLFDTYKGVSASLESDKPKLFCLLDELIDWSDYIPPRFYYAFYQRAGRPRKYPLIGFLKSLILQRIFGYTDDSLLLITLRHSKEMRDFCEFEKVPDASKLTRFKQDFLPYIAEVFERLVDVTEPICREMDAELSDMLLFDTTGVESYVTENNPKRLANGGPDAAASNSQVRLQYANGHMCYAQKAGILTNGLGIVRHVDLFDEDFRDRHPEMPQGKRDKNPEIDKEIGDSTALKPVLLDFRTNHPSFQYGTFSGDSAFDSYDNYSFLMNDYGFVRAAIPINPRNSNTSGSPDFNANGTPLCPVDRRPFTCLGVCGGKNRSKRLKFVCPESKPVLTSRVNMCKNPCVSNMYGRCVYTYPDKNLRLYPGISRDSDEFAQIYNVRTAVERTINTLKNTLGIANRKTSNVLTTKADLFLAGIVQLLCVVLAGKLHDRKLLRRVRKLTA